LVKSVLSDQVSVPSGVAALESKPLDAGGYRVLFKPGNRRGSRFVEMPSSRRMTDSDAESVSFFEVSPCAHGRPTMLCASDAFDTGRQRRR
jgi:hypothetical protein